MNYGVRVDMNCGGEFLWKELALTCRRNAGGGASRRHRLAIGFDSYNQAIEPECSHTVRLPSGADNYAKVIVRYE